MRLNDFSVVEKNSLPIQFGELFEAGCYNTVSSELQGKDKFKVENGAMNIRVKMSYSANPNCVMLREMEDLRYLNFTVDYHYSLVKLSELADRGYEPVEYPAVDESHYGFFKTTIKSKTVDNHDHYMGLRSHYMNRWSPNKSEIVYYLNDDFYQPEMENILASTENAIATVNSSLKLAGANFTVKLKDGREKDIGDIRNNFLVLVSDPQASGVIGYGPTAANPKTGEILNARTVMYYGTIKKFIARTYDELVEETLMSGQQSQTGASTAAAAKAKKQNALVGSKSLEPSVYFLDQARKADFTSFERLQNAWLGQIADLVHLEQADIDLTENSQISSDLKAFKKKMAKLSEQTFFHGSMVNFEDAVKKFILEKRKMWDQLSESERASIIDQLLPSVWIPTLVHEFGHNLGLRHNFYGSTDEENYYSAKERENLGISRDVTYSSIMDYSYSTLNELPVMGKYDVAALRFAYAREAETVKGKSVKIKTSLARLMEEDKKTFDQVKRFKYCSDEHVSNDPVCNRFDEGKTHLEVVSHYIKAYNKDYSKRNFRNRRYDFSGYAGDWSYAIGAFNSLGMIRQFFDLYDQRLFRGDYEKADASKERKAELADIKAASDMAFGALMDIVETPAYHCLEIYVQNGQVAGIGESKPFNEMAKGTKLEEYGITFDIANGCEYLSYFESQNPSQLPPGVQKQYLSFGKYFNNSLDLAVPYDQKPQGDTSQIDVRGFWMDKVVASIFLSSRSQSPTNIGAASNGSFLDHPEYKERFLKFIDGLLSNSFSKEVALSSGGQEIGRLKMNYSFDGSHKVNKSYNQIVNYVFGLEQTQTDLKTVMMKFLKENFKVPQSTVDLNRDIKLFHDFNAKRLEPQVDVSLYNYDEIVEFSNTSGEVVYRFGLYGYNSYGLKLASMKKGLEKIKALGQESLETLQATLEALSKAQSNEEVQAIISALEDAALVDIFGNHQEALASYLDGTLTIEGLLSSFMALTK